MRRCFLTAVAVAAVGLAGFGGLVAAGVVEVRRPVRPDPAPGPTPDPGPRVAEVTEADTVLKLLGHWTKVFRYDGGPIDCWIEVTAGGKREEVEASLARQLRLDSQTPISGGYIAWVRHESTGKEVWDLAVAAVGPGGKGWELRRSFGMSPPLPAAPVRMLGFNNGASQPQPLRPGEVVDLCTVTGYAADQQEVVWTAVLKCRLAADAPRP